MLCSRQESRYDSAHDGWPRYEPVPAGAGEILRVGEKGGDVPVAAWGL